MFDFSFAELALIVVVAVVFIGPKELPAVVRAAAKAMRVIKGLTGEIRHAFDELAEESGLKASAAELEREVRMIKGDDGQYYESYGLPPIVKKPEPPADEKRDG